MNNDEVDLSYGSEDIILLTYGLASDELISQFMEMNRVLMTAGYTAQLDVFELMHVSIERDELDSQEIVVEVDNVLREAARISLLECGITYDEDISFDMLIELAEAILSFDTSESPQDLLDVLDASEDDHDALLEVLEVLTTRETGDWLTVISEVGTGVIDRIRDLALEAVSMDYSVTDSDYQLNDRLSKLKSLSVNNEQRSALINSLETIDTTPSLESLYLIHLNSLLGAPMETVVDSLHSLSYISTESYKESFESASSLLDDYYSDPMERQKAGQLLYNLKKEHDSIGITDEVTDG